MFSIAEKRFIKLDSDLRKRIKNKLTEMILMDNPIDHVCVKPLMGELRGFYRFRIGDYRLIFSLIKEEKIIAIVNISSRGGAYK
ncbi:MAG: type II toxin-antitoxin system RelE/ParE family toxin [Candidatus Acididesulfobacter diazotrophicus]|uniref:Type II toxin-antitoxin system RelE/ParE family toxin n=1 Tax=Candidatus Acididesulfobacter diazotrophicus TaxID=2597226 RepID=A0A519BMZ2_9DELT|nr:MAG: type II toxin-antitoxin system RelE/ParE family toxin [Candidatus Acididesulfobacter diazotrophicus]